MELQLYRDRIDELKHKISNLLWKSTALLTGFIGIMSILYLIWYNQNESSIRIFLVCLFIFFIVKFGNNIRKNVLEIRKINKRITKNYDILLNR